MVDFVKTKWTTTNWVRVIIKFENRVKVFVENVLHIVAWFCFQYCVITIQYYFCYVRCGLCSLYIIYLYLM